LFSSSSPIENEEVIHQQQQQEQQQQPRQSKKRIFDVTEGTRTRKTARIYRDVFKGFLSYVKINDAEVLLDYSIHRPQIIKEMLVHYVLYLRDDKKLTRSSIKVYLAGILHFFQINNDDFNLTIRHFRIHLPSDDVIISEDRAYTHQEIAQILRACDKRSRMMILMLCSSGMRIGALSTLQIGDLTLTNTKINGNSSSIYRIQVYARTRGKYFSFCTPECFDAIQDYLNYRIECKERLTDKSPLIREQSR
jgi:integrase